MRNISLEERETWIDRKRDDAYMKKVRKGLSEE